MAAGDRKGINLLVLKFLASVTLSSCYWECFTNHGKSQRNAIKFLFHTDSESLLKKIKLNPYIHFFCEFCLSQISPLSHQKCLGKSQEHVLEGIV